MRSHHDRTVAVTALKGAVPYLRLYQGKVFVIKAGGEAFADRERARGLLEQVGILHQLGVRVVLVHGGGTQTTELGRELGIEPRFVDGRRVTGERTLDAATMAVNGRLRTGILALCRELGVPALGVSGIDAGLVRARRRPPRASRNGEVVDFGLVGDIEGVDASVLHRLLDGGFLPVVSPFAADDGGSVLNVNADGVAARLARELPAEKLIVATGAPGILRDPADARSVVSYLDLEGLEALRAAGSLAEGMLPKADAIEDALRGGVPRVHVVSHRTPDSLLLEVFTNEGAGTLVVGSTETLRPAEVGEP